MYGPYIYYCLTSGAAQSPQRPEDKMKDLLELQRISLELIEDVMRQVAK